LGANVVTLWRQQEVHLPAAHKVSWAACLYSQNVEGITASIMVQFLMQVRDCICTNHRSSIG
jgi:hypothetical protein